MSQPTVHQSERELEVILHVEWEHQPSSGLSAV